MLVIRDTMFCKPGKVRPMVQKMLALVKFSEKRGMKMRVMTDVSTDRFWTVVSEIEAPSLESFMAMGPDSPDAKDFQEIMKDYHELVDHGRREIYNLES